MSKSNCATEDTISGFIQTNPESQLKTENITKRKPRLGQPKQSIFCCGQFFPSTKPWKRHDDQIHPKEITCTNCGKSLKANNYWRHIIECTGVGRMKCPWNVAKWNGCMKCPWNVAKSKKSARNHKNNQHSGVWYSCNQCKYESKTQTNLRLDRESQHEGVRYACEQCEREFTRQRNLRDHIDSAH